MNKKVHKRHHEMLDELIEKMRTTLHNMLDTAYTSGALPEYMKEETYVLPKAIVTIWSRKELFSSNKKQIRKDTENLGKFV